MADRREAAEAALNDLASRDGVLGAALVARDGLPVVHRFRTPCNEDAVCAMGAAILGAGDAALLELGAGEATSFSIWTQGARLSGVALDDDLILLVCTDGSVDADGATDLVDDACANMRTILQEA